VTTQETNELAIVRVLTPAVVFAPGGVDEVLGKIKAEVQTIDRDISTEQGRAVIRSTAYKIARSKTALDKMGKELGEQHFKAWKGITGERARIEKELDALRESFRKPLTDWEQAEFARLAAHEYAIKQIIELGKTEPGFTSQALQARIDELIAMPERDWQEFAKRASDTSMSVMAALNGQLQEAKRQEAERAELERLRQERIAREQAERDARIAAEAAELARRRAEEIAKAEAEAEERRVREVMDKIARDREQERRLAQEEQARVAREKEIAERARHDAERMAARAEEQRIAAERRAEQDRIDAAKPADEERQAAIEAERRRVSEEKAKAEAEDAARAANRRHRERINREARDALVALSLTTEHAALILNAIAAGKVPHVKITY